jgi:monovalent cation/hydrogen antiporter
MEHVELVLLFLLVAVAALSGLARALDVPYPILLVLGGSVIGFVPGGYRTSSSTPTLCC